MLATIVLLEELHGIYFDEFKAPGAGYMHFDEIYIMDVTISLIGLQRRPRCWNIQYFSQWYFLRHQAN